jgi:hypothetical protein
LGLTDADPSTAVAPHQLPLTVGRRLEAPGIWYQWTHIYEPLRQGPSLSLASSVAPPHSFTSTLKMSIWSLLAEGSL